mmetsp:Transcript_22165/g.39795  ORF Transcript_22165/g.39795 Transcript_22165/m.39795 type:complete len:203 (+) Transcript_22165:103-711(+)
MPSQLPSDCPRCGSGAPGCWKCRPPVVAVGVGWRPLGTCGGAPTCASQRSSLGGPTLSLTSLGARPSRWTICRRRSVGWPRTSSGVSSTARPPSWGWMATAILSLERWWTRLCTWRSGPAVARSVSIAHTTTSTSPRRISVAATAMTMRTATRAQRSPPKVLCHPKSPAPSLMQKWRSSARTWRTCAPPPQRVHRPWAPHWC